MNSGVSLKNPWSGVIPTLYIALISVWCGVSQSQKNTCCSLSVFEELQCLQASITLSGKLVLSILSNVQDHHETF